jgi:hypothetical protein
MSLPRAEEWTDPGSMDPPPARWGRRFLATICLLLVALAGSFAIWWGMSLRRLPEIGPPFDLNAESTLSIPESENAFLDYREAVSKLVGERLADRFGRFQGWPQLTQLERDWFFANAAAVGLWFDGTAKDRAANNQGDVVQGMRTLNLLARIAGSRMESEGEPDEAWDWYRAGLRASRHLGMHGSFIERLAGIALYTDIAESIRVWSDHPGLSRTAIRQALDDLITINAMTPSLGDNLRSEYLATRSLLDDPELTVSKIDRERSIATAVGGPNPSAGWKERFARFLKREPERSHRLLNLLFANWLSADGRPESDRATRRRTISGRTYLDWPADAGSPGRPAPEELDRWLESTLFLRRVLPPFSAFEKAERREAALRAALVIELAERLYARDHGKRPESPEQLVGPYLKALPDGYGSASSGRGPITERDPP